jgi:hypothetical protein
VKDENGDLLANSHVLNKWKNCFCQLLKVQRISDFRQKEMHIPELLVHDPNPLEVEIAIAT